MKIATLAVAALALALAAPTSASSSLRGLHEAVGDVVLTADMDTESGPSYESNVWDITRSFVIDETAPNFIRVGVPIFDFGASEVTVSPRNDHTTVMRSFESSIEGARESSFNLGVSGGAFGFSAAASMSTSRLNKDKKKYVRIDHNIDTCISVVQMEPVNPHKYLRPDVKNLLLTRTPEYILSEIGPFYASQFTLGATFELRVVGEVSSEEQAHEFKGELSANYLSIVKVKIGGETKSSSKKSCTDYDTEYKTSGGDPRIWLGTKSLEEKLDDWQDSITAENLRPIQHQLKYIWELLDHDDMDRVKAEEVKSYIMGQWEAAGGRVAAQEAEFAYVDWKKARKVEGNIQLRQPVEESGDYKNYSDEFEVRSVIKTACQFVRGYEDDGLGRWGLDELYCRDNSRCLKWGGNAYVGRLTLPKGIKARTFGDWKLTEKLKDREITGEEEEMEFDVWNRDHKMRAKGFKFSLLPGFTCDEGELSCS